MFCRLLALECFVFILTHQSIFGHFYGFNAAKLASFFICNQLVHASESNSESVWGITGRKKCGVHNHILYRPELYLLACTLCSKKNYMNCKILGSDSAIVEESCLLDFRTTLKMESESTSETLVTTQHHIPQDLSLQLCELLVRKHIPLNGWTQTGIFTCIFVSMFRFSRFLWLVWVYLGLDISLAGCSLICLNSHQMIHWLFQ